MAIPDDGPLEISQINLELDRPAGALFSFNDPQVRELAEIPIGDPISMSDFYGKSWIRQLVVHTLTTPGAGSFVTDPECGYIEGSLRGGGGGGGRGAEGSQEIINSIHGGGGGGGGQGALSNVSANVAPNETVSFLVAPTALSGTVGNASTLSGAIGGNAAGGPLGSPGFRPPGNPSVIAGAGGNGGGPGGAGGAGAIPNPAFIPGQNGGAGGALGGGGGGEAGLPVLPPLQASEGGPGGQGRIDLVEWTRNPNLIRKYSKIDPITGFAIPI